jgi:Long-chain acyl-CoA synthetases (AMP-forming)
MKITDLPDFDWPNFAYFFQDVTTRFADRIAMRYRSRGELEFDEWSYARVGAEGSALAAYLLSRGLSTGDRAVIWAENRPEWGVAYFALVAAGIVAVPVDVLLPEEDVARLVAAADPKAILASGKFSDRVAEVTGGRGVEAESVVAVVGLDGRPAAMPGAACLSWKEAIEEGRASGRKMPAPASIPSDALASLIFTSGTTGRPKAVMLAHRGIIENLGASIHALPICKEDVFMCVLPLHHTYPTTCSLLSPLAVGAAITITEKLVGKVIIDDARDTGGTVFIAVPLLYDKVAQALMQGVKAKGGLAWAGVSVMRSISRAGLALGAPGVGRALFKGLRKAVGLGTARLLVAGGGPLSAATAQVFDELGFNIVQGYGMSENGPLISTNSPEHHDHRSAGRIVRRTELRIASAGDEEFAEKGMGEIQVRSPSLMKGYWRDPEATAAAFTEDGWLRTGDVGMVDERGFIFITGRIKSIIVTAGGKNIYPEEIESLFDGSRVAREVLVLGKPRAEGREEETAAAEEVAAVIVPDLEAIAADQGKAAAADPEAVHGLVKAEIERVNRSLPPYKKLCDFYVRSEEFEKTSSKKIKRYLYKTWAIATGEKR